MLCRSSFQIFLRPDMARWRVMLSEFSQPKSGWAILFAEAMLLQSITRGRQRLTGRPRPPCPSVQNGCVATTLLHYIYIMLLQVVSLQCVRSSWNDFLGNLNTVLLSGAVFFVFLALFDFFLRGTLYINAAFSSCSLLACDPLVSAWIALRSAKKTCVCFLSISSRMER